MHVNYKYRISSRFYNWLKVNKPNLYRAIERECSISKRKPENVLVNCHVELDDYMRPIYHIIAFIGFYINECNDFDGVNNREDPYIELKLHPDLV